MKHIEVQMHQSNQNCLVYFDVKVDDLYYSGDALNVMSALKLIEHYLERMMNDE